VPPIVVQTMEDGNNYLIEYWFISISKSSELAIKPKLLALSLF
jgi:hypothetical protein